MREQYGNRSTRVQYGTKVLRTDSTYFKANLLEYIKYKIVLNFSTKFDRCKIPSQPRYRCAAVPVPVPVPLEVRYNNECKTLYDHVYDCLSTSREVRY